MAVPAPNYGSINPPSDRSIVQHSGLKYTSIHDTRTKVLEEFVTYHAEPCIAVLWDDDTVSCHAKDGKGLYACEVFSHLVSSGNTYFD